MNQIIFYTQIISAIVLVVLITLQQRGTALGSAFGGSGEFYASRRGIQKKMHYATIATAGLFIVLSILNLAL